MRAYEVADKFWQSEPCRLGRVGLRWRDVVIVEESSVSYLLWGHEIARWDKGEGTLVVSDCGWQTWLTKDRLNNILSDLRFSIYGDRGKWFIWDRLADKSFYWEGHHTIYLEKRVLEPARLRVRHQEVSERLRAYYRRAREAVEAKHGMYVARTLDGTAYIFVDGWYGRRVDTLVVKTHSPEFEAYHGCLRRSAVYALFLRHSLDKVLGRIGKELERVEGDKAEFVLSKLQEMGFKPSDLPGDLSSALALAKLVEC